MIGFLWKSSSKLQNILEKCFMCNPIFSPKNWSFGRMLLIFTYLIKGIL